jgi:putative salt-induced outer membrane protein
LTNLRKLLTLSLLLLAASTTFAQNEEGFSGIAALGFLSTSGNTESENLSMNFDLGWNYAPWHHSLKGSAVTASSSNVTTAEAYAMAWQSDYDLSDGSYAFGIISWNDDKFSGYQKQIRETLGYGRRIIDTERHILNGEVGFGYRQADLSTGLSQDESIMRLSADYLWHISETADFSQTLAFENGSDNTFTESVTKLTADVRANFSIVFSYTVRNNSDVPIGTVKKDTFTAVALEYTF